MVKFSLKHFLELFCRIETPFNHKIYRNLRDDAELF